MSTLRNAYTRLLCSLMVAGTLSTAKPASSGSRRRLERF